MISLIDTNVIVRFLTGTTDEKFKGVYKFFQDIEKGKISVELKLIVLFQTIFVLKSFYRVPKGQLVKAMKTLLKFNGLKITDKRIVVRTMEIWDAENIEIVDAYLVACIEKDPQNILYSFDNDFDKLICLDEVQRLPEIFAPLR